MPEAVLATHQVVNNSEFPHAMVVMDDKLAGSKIPCDQIFSDTELSKSDKESVEKGKETTIDHTLCLLCATCSRAKESSALVFWSSDLAGSLTRVKDSGWFSDDEFQAI